MNNFMQYVRDSINELQNHVTWPSATELQQTTMIVLIASLLLGLLIYGLDQVWVLLLSILY